MGADGSTATVKSGGVGHLGADGAASYRGWSTYQTTSDSLAKLNGLVVVFEYETTPDGKASGTSWEWK